MCADITFAIVGRESTTNNKKEDDIMSKEYIVKRTTPDAFDIGVLISQSRKTLEVATMDIDDKVFRIRDKVSKNEIDDIYSSISMLHLIIRALEDIEEGAFAME